MVAANLQDRYGTEAENPEDQQKIQTVWKYAPNAYQNEFIAVLPYCEYAPYSQAGAVIGSLQQFKVNSIFDPDLSGVGGQPLGRDTYAAIYNYYKVLETHIDFELIETTNYTAGSTGSSAYPALYGWMADITATAPATSQSWLMAAEAGEMNKQQKFSEVKMFDCINGRGQKSLHFSYKWDASQFDTSIIDNSKNEWTAVGSDPTDLNYFSILCFNPSSSTKVAVIKYRIRYLVAFKQVNRTLLNTVN